MKIVDYLIFVYIFVMYSFSIVVEYGVYLTIYWMASMKHNDKTEPDLSAFRHSTLINTRYAQLRERMRG